MDINKGMNLEEYFNLASQNEKEKEDILYKEVVISREYINILKNIEEEISLMAFTAHYCPDCHITIAVLRKMMDYTDKIKLYIFDGEKYGEDMETLIGSTRIPAIVSYNKDMSPRGLYLEVPEKIGEKIPGLKALERLKLIKEYREGKYNELIYKQLISMIK